MQKKLAHRLLLLYACMYNMLFISEPEQHHLPHQQPQNQEQPGWRYQEQQRPHEQEIPDAAEIEFKQVSDAAAAGKELFTPVLLLVHVLYSVLVVLGHAGSAQDFLAVAAESDFGRGGGRRGRKPVKVGAVVPAGAVKVCILHVHVRCNKKNAFLSTKLFINGLCFTFREISVEILSPQPVGSFLVRCSESRLDSLALSVKVPNQSIVHYLIISNGQGWKIKVHVYGLVP
jgi:hypothetical protein